MRFSSTANFKVPSSAKSTKELHAFTLSAASQPNLTNCWSILEKYFLNWRAVNSDQSYFQILYNCNSNHVGGPPELSGFIWVNNPVVQGSNPKHTIYAFFIYSQISYLNCHFVLSLGLKLKTKRPILALFRKTFSVCVPNTWKLLFFAYKDRQIIHFLCRKRPQLT